MTPEEVVVEVENRVAESTPTVRFMLATALFEAGAGELAAGQYRLVLERQPHSAQARIALAEVLLYLRRYAQAADEAAELPVDSPLAAMAIRSELFGRIASADLTGFALTHERALASNLPEAERELFEGWAEIERGGASTIKLRLAAIPLLGVVLEALLRVEAFAAFEKLVGLLSESELAAREQHELLAKIYLRRGFVASAAAEWMGVCKEGADVRALLGLAQIARIQAMDDDAEVFVREALVLEPENAEALALLPARSRQAA
jgi:hypothetical protein